MVQDTSMLTIVEARGILRNLASKVDDLHATELGKEGDGLTTAAVTAVQVFLQVGQRTMNVYYIIQHALLC